MRCSHCQLISKQLVTETRQVGECLYRRRACGACGRRFVTVETAPAGLHMPAEAYPHKRTRAPKPPKPIKGDGHDLAAAWNPGALHE